ncbi:MAG: thioredoxin-dependent thiol peroxidase [Bacteroidota bacterium]|nr:thioredoxin-dependent thiol peroxidase [Bacteroidota bacterium]
MLELKEGQKAPVFSAKNQNGNNISLTQFLGKKVVLYFYPKDNTPGCTAQACNLSENIDNLKKNGFIVLGVSPDSEKSHLKFISKYNLSFDLIVDESKSICKLYGVWGPKKFMGREYDGVHRTTFLIDENGLIDKIITKVNTKNHTEQIL